MNVCPKDYVKVPKDDVVALIEAWKTRLNGKIESTGTVDEILQRWLECIEQK